MLDPNLAAAQAEKVVAHLFDLFELYLGDATQAPNQAIYQDFSLEYGNAICANEARKCVLDTWRTVKFLRGLMGAVKEKQAAYPGERVQVLYAGCGPYALFMTLLAPLFEPEAVGFTLLEVNPSSLEMADRLLTRLELWDYVDELRLQDAITYTIPTGKEFHVLLSETMDKALWNEAFVPILLNLRPQLSTRTTILPANVIVGATLYPFIEGKEGSSPVPADIKGLAGLDLGTVLNLSAGLEMGLGTVFSKKLEDLQQFGHIAFTTEVSVWQDMVLEQWESLITLPKLERLDVPSGASCIHLDYPMTKTLGLRIRFS